MIKCEHGDITIEGDLEDTVIELVHIIHAMQTTIQTLQDEKEEKHFNFLINCILAETERTKEFFEETTNYLKVEIHEKEE